MTGMISSKSNKISETITKWGTLALIPLTLFQMLKLIKRAPSFLEIKQEYMELLTMTTIAATIFSIKLKERALTQ